MAPNGLQRINRVLSGTNTTDVPVCPILHTMAAHLSGQPIGRFAASSRLMADCIISAYRRFGYDGVQLSLGVAGEAQAMGAPTAFPEDGLPVVVGQLLEKESDLARLQIPDASAGRLGLFVEAVERVHEAIGDEAWIVATIRGPLLMASQVRGVEDLLVDTLRRPEWVSKLLEFTTEVGVAFGKELVRAGANAIAIGEATCSPDFISPQTYTTLVWSHHCRLVSGLHEAGCRTTVMHICGGAMPIVSAVAETGTDVMDIDSVVDPVAARQAAGDELMLRGNIDPVDVLLYGSPEETREKTKALLNCKKKDRPVHPWLRLRRAAGCPSRQHRGHGGCGKSLRGVLCFLIRVERADVVTL